MNNNENNNGNGSNVLNDALVMLHCAAMSAMYAQELKENEGGYEPTTNIWEMLTVAETQGPEPVAEVVAVVLAAAKEKVLPTPEDALRDLFMALKYKVKLYTDPNRKANAASKILALVYTGSMDVAEKAIYDDMPEYVGSVLEDMYQ